VFSRRFAGPGLPGPFEFFRLLTYKQLGELGELAFLHKAISLGFRVSKPWGESCSYDFIVDWRGRLNRVQVKCVHRMHPRGSYHLKCSSSRTSPPFKFVHYRPAKVDFIAGYVVPEDTWYIIPVSLICRKDFVTIPRDPRRGCVARHREAWDLLQGSGRSGLGRAGLPALPRTSVLP